MKKHVLLIATIALTAPLQAADESLQLEVNGGSGTAPIYALEGTATTQFKVGGTIDVDQALNYSMDNVATGVVQTTGNLTVTRAQNLPYYSAWDARFSAGSEYRISSFGQLIVVQFNHQLQSTPGTHVIDGMPCASAQISSRGAMRLVDDQGSFSFEGNMKGVVAGFDGQGRHVTSIPYLEAFTQIISDMTEEGWGEWSGIYDIERTGNKLAGAGDLKIGSPVDPVDTVAQTIKGSYSARGNTFAWGAAGTETADKKVTVKITHKANDELVEGKNQIQAAGQRRKF